MATESKQKRYSPARERLKLQSTETPQTLPYGHNRGSALIIPNDYDRMKAKAVKAMFEHAEIQLNPLQEQMAFLSSKKEKLQLLPGHSDQSATIATEASLTLINEQVDLIQSQVQSIQKKYLISLEVLKAKFSFVPVHGETYYLYQKGHERVLMLVGPDQWKLKNDMLYIATIKLMADASWQVVQINKDLEMDFAGLL